MASFFRAPRPDDDGGKMLRGRRPLESPSHDIRPDGESVSASWISGIVAGAGRLVSSVFKSYSPSPSSSYSYSDDEESSINSDEDGDMDVSSKEPNKPMTKDRKFEAAKDCSGTSLAIISSIESKQAIEQLLMQETFSRDEGSQLIKLIESRVVEVGKDGICKGLNSSTCNAMASSQTWKYLNLSPKLPVSYSDGSLNAISPGSAHVLMPQVRSSVVTQDFAVEGSPVDVAKSYMQSLSPWRSKSSRSFDFEKTPCTEMHLPKDKAPFTTPNYHVPSSKVLKRSHDAFRSRDTADEIQRVRMKLTGDESDNSRFKLIDLSKRYSKDKPCQVSYVADELIHRNPSATLGLPGDKFQANYPVTMGNTSSRGPISDTEEAVNAVQSSHETSSLAILPLKLTSSVGIGPHICDTDVSFTDGNQHVKAHWQAKSQRDSLYGPRGTHIPSPTSMEHDGSDRSETLLYSEAQKLPSIDINSPPSDGEAGARVDGVSTSNTQLSRGVECNPLDQELISCDNGIHPTAGSDSIRQICEEAEQDGNDQMQGKATGLKPSADGSSAGLNPNDATNFSNGELTTIITERTYEHLSADVTSILGPKTTNAGRARSASRGGLRVRSIKDAPTEPKASTSRGRGRKSVPGARRGRGRQITPPDTGS